MIGISQLFVYDNPVDTAKKQNAARFAEGPTKEPVWSSDEILIFVVVAALHLLYGQTCVPQVSLHQPRPHTTPGSYRILDPGFLRRTANAARSSDKSCPRISS